MSVCFWVFTTLFLSVCVLRLYYSFIYVCVCFEALLLFIYVCVCFEALLLFYLCLCVFWGFTTLLFMSVFVLRLYYSFIYVNVCFWSFTTLPFISLFIFWLLTIYVFGVMTSHVMAYNLLTPQGGPCQLIYINEK